MILRASILDAFSVSTILPVCARRNNPRQLWQLRTRTAALGKDTDSEKTTPISATNILECKLLFTTLFAFLGHIPDYVSPLGLQEYLREIPLAAVDNQP